MSRTTSMRRLAALCAAGTLAAGLSACQLKDDGADLVAGKEAFIAKCGSCHVLNRAGTKGVQGPNLDEAFRVAVSEGFGRNTIEGVVRAQIAVPNREAQLDPKAPKHKKTRTTAMPANLVEGELAEDVAAYVAFATARGGEDVGRLADAGTKKSEEATKAENGTLKIDAVPDGATLFVFGSATAPTGPLTLTSVNESSIPHNIAVEGNGVNELGEVVQNGGTSQVEVDLTAGEYTFFCSVPGHREGGMEGKLTVE